MSPTALHTLKGLRNYVKYPDSYVSRSPRLRLTTRRRLGAPLVSRERA